MVTTPIWQQASQGTRGGLSGGSAPGPQGTPDPAGRKRWLVGVGVALAAAVMFAGTDAPSDLMAGPAPEAVRATPVGAPTVRPADEAFGASGELRMRYARAGDAVEFPLAVQGDPRG
ncbi:MAG: hypothetical protein MUE41_14235, partial [Gemmatimonadaceae bacterium]|nr:hypothetical protein [Gemmatimonadaceae bacterium]